MNLQEFKELIKAVIAEADAKAAELAAKNQELSNQLLVLNGKVLDLQAQVAAGGQAIDLQALADELQLKTQTAHATATELAAESNPTPTADALVKVVEASSEVPTPPVVDVAVNGDSAGNGATVDENVPTEAVVVEAAVDAVISAVQ